MAARPRPQQGPRLFSLTGRSWGRKSSTPRAETASTPELSELPQNHKSNPSTEGSSLATESRRPPAGSGRRFRLRAVRVEGRGALLGGSSLRWASPDRDLGGLRGAVSDVRDADLVPRRLGAHRGGQVSRALDRLAREGRDHVTGLQACVRCRRAALDAGDLSPRAICRGLYEDAEVRMLNLLA